MSLPHFLSVSFTFTSTIDYVETALTEQRQAFMLHKAHLIGFPLILYL